MDVTTQLHALQGVVVVLVCAVQVADARRAARCER